jgi:hypothetical protein
MVPKMCFLCSPPDLNFLDPYFIFMYMHYNQCHRTTAHLQLNIHYTGVLISPKPDPTEKTVERSLFFVRRGGHFCRGDVVALSIF